MDNEIPAERANPSDSGELIKTEASDDAVYGNWWPRRMCVAATFQGQMERENRNWITLQKMLERVERHATPSIVR